MDIHDIILASRAEPSYSTRARWALRAIRKYLRLGLAPSWRYKILHAHARAIFSTALKAAVISIYIPLHNTFPCKIRDYIPLHNTFLCKIRDYIPLHNTFLCKIRDYIPLHHTFLCKIRDYIPLHNTFLCKIRKYIPLHHITFPCKIRGCSCTI